MKLSICKHFAQLQKVSIIQDSLQLQMMKTQLKLADKRSEQANETGQDSHRTEGQALGTSWRTEIPFKVTWINFSLFTEATLWHISRGHCSQGNSRGMIPCKAQGGVRGWMAPFGEVTCSYLWFCFSFYLISSIQIGFLPKAGKYGQRSSSLYPSNTVTERKENLSF